MSLLTLKQLLSYQSYLFFLHQTHKPFKKQQLYRLFAYDYGPNYILRKVSYLELYLDTFFENVSLGYLDTFSPMYLYLDTFFNVSCNTLPDWKDRDSQSFSQSFPIWIIFVYQLRWSRGLFQQRWYLAAMDSIIKHIERHLWVNLINHLTR